MTALERFNSFSHLLGALAAVAGTVWLLMVTTAGDAWRLTSFSIYGTALILLYAISSLSHGYEGGRRGILTRLDHCTIYLLAMDAKCFCCLKVRKLGKFGQDTFECVATLLP